MITKRNNSYQFENHTVSKNVGLFFTSPETFINNHSSIVKDFSHMLRQTHRKQFIRVKKSQNSFLQGKQRSKSALEFIMNYKNQKGATLGHSTINSEQLMTGYQPKIKNKYINLFKDKITELVDQPQQKYLQFKQTSLSPKVKQTNLLVLSKRENKVKNTQKSKYIEKSKSLRKNKQQNTIQVSPNQPNNEQKKFVSILPQFYHSKSSFHRGKNNEVQKQKILNNTIFTTTGFRCEFFKKRKLETLEFEKNNRQKKFIFEEKNLSLKEFLQARSKQQLKERLDELKRGQTPPYNIQGWEIPEESATIQL